VTFRSFSLKLDLGFTEETLPNDGRFAEDAVERRGLRRTDTGGLATLFRFAPRFFTPTSDVISSESSDSADSMAAECEEDERDDRVDLLPTDTSSLLP
jgi:hypothetical protein